MVENGVEIPRKTTKYNKSEFKFRHHFVLTVVSSVFGSNNGFCYKYIYVLHLIYSIFERAFPQNYDTEIRFTVKYTLIRNCSFVI